MFSDFDFDVIARSARYLLVDGLGFTLTLTALATAGGVVFGTLLALARLSSLPLLPRVAGLYVNVLRSLPLVLVIFWFYFLVPYIGQWITGASRPIQVGAFWSALITFTLFEAAYFCEIIRAGIQSIPRGQIFAGQALGMSYGQNMKLVILPQAFRNMLPVLLTQTIILFQDTSLVYIITAHDMLHGFSVAGSNLSHPREAYILAAVFYFVICFSLSYIVKQLQKKIAIIR